MLTPHMMWSSYNSSGTAFGTSQWISTRLYTSKTAYTVTSYQWLYKVLDDTVCSTEEFSTTEFSFGTIAPSNYDVWSQKYGFCESGPNGPVNFPKEIKVMQWFSVLALASAVFVTILGCQSSEGSKHYLLGAAVGVFGFISSVVVYATASGFEYYKDLRSGVGYLPVYVTDARSTNSSFVGASVPQGMSFATAFFSCIFISIALLSASLLFLVEYRLFRKQERELDLDKPADRSSVTPGDVSLVQLHSV